LLWKQQLREVQPTVKRLKMKKTKNKDPFQTFCWLREVIYDPYKVVTCCFENDSIVSYRKTIKKSLFFAEKKKIFHKGDPCNLVFDFKVFNSVVKAADSINRQNREPTSIISSTEFMDTRLYSRETRYFTPWDFFPRHVTRKEYKNPYRALKIFFQYQSAQQWELTLHDVLDAALSSYGEETDLDLLSIYYYLLKLMEALHLIELRELTVVNNLQTKTD
jgi:hypothetical protein